MSRPIHALLLEHLPRLQAYARRLTRSSADADDLVQTAALKILNCESQFLVGTHFGAWSYAILRNSCFSDSRKTKRRQMVSIDGMSKDATAHISLVTHPSQEAHVLGSEILRARRSLRPHLRQTLALMGEHGLTCDQAAAAMSCSTGTVKSRLWRARAEMRVLLGDNSDEPQERVTIAQRS